MCALRSRPEGVDVPLIGVEDPCLADPAFPEGHGLDHLRVESLAGAGGRCTSYHDRRVVVVGEYAEIAVAEGVCCE